MSKARIAIPVPTSFDAQYNDQNWPAYAESIRLSGGEPVRVDLNETEQEIGRILSDCGGILLPGSPADVDPTLYGQQRQEFTAAKDEDRERVDRLLLESAWQERKPVLAICFGVQMLNVWRGGTLVQDLAPVPVNHAAGRAVTVAHSLTLDPSSLLGTLLSSSEIGKVRGFLRLPVNSSHHQAIGIPGSGLRISARSTEDSVVEAVEGVDSERFVLGVQWHPERTFASSPASRLLFQHFVAAATKTSPATLQTAAR